MAKRQARKTTHRRNIALALLFFSALFLLISLVSYNFYFDPKTSHSAVGRWGYWLANFLTYSLGITAYFVPLACTHLGTKLLTKKPLPLFTWLFVIAASSTLMTSFNAALGGTLGIITSNWGCTLVGIIGTNIFATLLLLLGLTILGLPTYKITQKILQFCQDFIEVLYLSLRYLVKFTHQALTQGVRFINYQTLQISSRLLEQVKAGYKMARLAVKARPPIPTTPTKKAITTQPSIIKSLPTPPPKPPAPVPAKNPPPFNPATTKFPPSIELLDPVTTMTDQMSHAELQQLAKTVEEKLLDFAITAEVATILPGPVVTRFELNLAPGTKVSKLSALAKDLARILSVVSIRVVEVIPGKTFVGLEIPNKQRAIVALRDLLESADYQNAPSPLTLAFGKDIAGLPVIVDLSKMPHLLIAGTTGSGKSVGINAMLLSILYKAPPEMCRLILIDPKMLELSIYSGIPHLLAPVVTDMKDAASALGWCVAEMERRYSVMAKLGVRNLAGLNLKVAQAKKENRTLTINNDNGEPEEVTAMPFIVIIIDEFADMMMVVGKKVEALIARIAQKARASGMHMLLATQRPSVDVITGLIKANVPTRVAFQVASKIDSRTILDQQGAEQLLGHGDMLYLAPGSGIPQRIHGAFVGDDEVHRVVNFLRQTGTPNYALDLSSTPLFTRDIDSNDEEQDPLFIEAKEFVVKHKRPSISSLQRHFKIGFNRAARLMETLEAQGIVSGMQMNGVREVND